MQEEIPDLCKYVVIGRYYNSNKKFKKVFAGTPQGRMWAMGINLWNGRVYAEDWNGKRKLIKQVTN